MSVAGYLSAGKPELRMPKKGRNELGIRFDGTALTGEKSVLERLAADAVSRTISGGEYYEKVEDYDPVLRAHCRL